MSNHLIDLKDLETDEIQELLYLTDRFVEVSPVSYTHLTLPTTPYL